MGFLSKLHKKHKKAVSGSVKKAIKSDPIGGKSAGAKMLTGGGGRKAAVTGVRTGGNARPSVRPAMKTGGNAPVSRAASRMDSLGARPRKGRMTP